MIEKGIIKGFRGSWGSGLGFLLIEQDSGSVVSVPCDNAPTVRALEGCFGNVIGENHSVAENPGFVDQEIFYSMDDFGLCLGGFTPVDEASQELIEAYEDQEEV